VYPEMASPDPEVAQAGWYKSTRCVEDGACVEMAALGEWVGMRDSKDPDRVLLFGLLTWRDFLAEVKAGTFDDPASRP
jgi:uncharacterized protein DUF397